MSSISGYESGSILDMAAADTNGGTEYGARDVLGDAHDHLVARRRTHAAQNPVLMLTARDAAGDVVRGLDAGADDYLILAYRERSYPWSALVIPALGEGLQSIPGYLEVQDAVRIEDWAAFLDRSRPEEIPWWGYEAIKTTIKLAARSARLALVESGLGSGDLKLSERLETIENQVHAIHGGQRPAHAEAA
jgi:CheY-like chemotaxis protein